MRIHPGLILSLAGCLALSVPAFPRGGGHGGGHSSAGHSYSGGSVNPRSTAVHSDTTPRGRPVASYRRTEANTTQRDNYSARGNRNPVTGKAGTKKVKH